MLHKHICITVLIFTILQITKPEPIIKKSMTKLLIYQDLNNIYLQSLCDSRNYKILILIFVLFFQLCVHLYTRTLWQTECMSNTSWWNSIDSRSTNWISTICTYFLLFPRSRMKCQAQQQCLLQGKDVIIDIDAEPICHWWTWASA